ncbi:hypothetical protein [Mesorhizobium sp. M0019]
MNLLLRVKGASGEEISRGVLAAEAVLECAGITAGKQQKACSRSRAGT